MLLYFLHVSSAFVTGRRFAFVCFTGHSSSALASVFPVVDLCVCYSFFASIGPS